MYVYLSWSRVFYCANKVNKPETVLIKTAPINNISIVEWNAKEHY